MPEEVRQPMAIAEAVVIETADDSKEEQIQLEEDIAMKRSNKEEQTPQYVAEDTAEISTTSYTDQHDKGQTSDAEREQGIEDDENFGPQKDAKAIAETNKMHLLEEEVQTISPTHAFVQSDMEQISEEELLHVDESKFIDYIKQNCIRETNLETESNIAQVRRKWCEEVKIYIYNISFAKTKHQSFS